MTTALFAILLSSAGPRVQVLWRTPLPPQAAHSARAGRTHFSALYDPKSGGVIWDSIYQDRSRIFWFDPHQRKVVLIGEGSLAEPQIDCDLGLATVHRFHEWTTTVTETYSLRTGKLLSTVVGGVKRVGRAVMTREANRTSDEQVTTYTDAVTGNLLWKEAMTNRTAEKILAPMGTPIWITPKRWLFIIGEGGYAHGDSKGVVDINSKTFKENKRVHLSDLAMGFAGIVGNPEQGSFGVFESTNRSRECTGIFRSDLSRVPGRFSHPTDISRYGILDRRGKAEMYRDIDYNSIVCADATTGKVKWKASSKEPGRWVDGNVLTGDRLLDGKTGRSLGKLKLPKLLAVGQDGAFVGIEGLTLIGGRIRAR